MAGEIVIPLKLWLERDRNPNGTWDHFHGANDKHSLSGWLFPNDLTTEINWCLSRPIPSNINVTPAGKIYFHWGTTSADTTSLVQWLCNLIDVQYNTTVADPSAWDDSLAVQDASNGVAVENECSVAIVTATLTSGRGVRGVIQRDATAGHGDDTLEASVWLTEAFLVADQT